MNRRRRTACLCRVLLATVLLGNALAPMGAIARAATAPPPVAAVPVAGSDGVGAPPRPWTASPVPSTPVRRSVHGQRPARPMRIGLSAPRTRQPNRLSPLAVARVRAAGQALALRRERSFAPASGCQRGTVRAATMRDVAGQAACAAGVVASSLAIRPAVMGGSCPSGWSCADIGNPTLAGGQSLSGGIWTVQGEGDIYGSSDQFHFVWQTVAGDGGVTARVASQTAPSPYAKAGVMLRQDTSAGAPFYYALVAPAGSVDVLYRPTAAAAVVDLGGPGGGAPVYLKVARVGGSYTAYTSSDGLAWAAVSGSTVSMAMTGTVLGGLAVTSSTASALETATIDSVTVSACPPGWVCTDIGQATLPGGQALSAGTWTVQGSGYGIFGSADTFHFVSQPVAGDAALSARLAAQTNTNQFAKAGVMLRQDSSPGSAYYYAYVTPGPSYGGVNVEYRGTAGGTTVGIANPGGAPPVYLKVARAGATYTAYTSADGVTWSAVAGSSVTMATTGALLAGLAVSADDGGRISTGTFDTVTVTSTSSPRASGTTPGARTRAWPWAATPP